ncbi:hypothetical protein VMCG_08243 [Cytospora schulzeri]|uniref:Uncharacterized protein n=1 Tax=Cytospora schulzeri TaxID=448051 RepID=A0A423VSN8_9PEZI|nr:hypothetical protein VMCG_08243 [Valsa malicola]
MRLINTTTLDLEVFIGHHLPRYAILSHTWGEEEVSLQDWSNRNDPSSTISARSGYAKIVACCRTAREDGYDYVWIDTCCIDKTSSAELTESINSMFRWYGRAEVCYAYLIDFDASASSFFSGAKGCVWFTRGWTLQELIAPMAVRFYDVEWQLQGTRDEHGKELEVITGIDSPVLAAPGSHKYLAPYKYSVADRMSWAASRETTRTEDTAYCLLGLFNVNLPLIYGEGLGAFRRLQEAIMRSNNDLTILAWGMSHPSAETRGLHLNKEEEPIEGADIALPPTPVVHRRPSSFQRIQDRPLFATYPSAFVHSKRIREPSITYRNPEIAITSKGLRCDASLAVGRYDGSHGYFLHVGAQRPLDCSWGIRNENYILLRLQKISPDKYFPDGLVEDGSGLELTRHTGLMSFYISHKPQGITFQPLLTNGFDEVYIPKFESIQLKKTIPETQWNAVNRLFYTHEESNPLVLAAWFEARIPPCYKELDFIVLFKHTVTCEECSLMYGVLNCKEYPRQSKWIFGDRGPGRDLLWCDLEFFMPEFPVGDYGMAHISYTWTSMDDFRVYK